MLTTRHFWLTVSACVILATVAGIALADASMTADHGGSEEGGEFSDDNGFLEEERPGAPATWASTNASLTANDPSATKSKEGGAIDNKKWTGVIGEAVQPGWLWQLEAGMSVSVLGFEGGAVNGTLEGVGTAVLAYWGDGGPLYAATEVKTTNSGNLGDYNIDIEVDDQSYTIVDGGHSVQPDYSGGGPGGGGDSISIDEQFAIYGTGVQFTYESRANCSVQLDFTTADGNSTVQVDVEHYVTPGTLDEWTGAAWAWDFNPTNPHVIRGFVLDPQ